MKRLLIITTMSVFVFSSCKEQTKRTQTSKTQQIDSMNSFGTLERYFRHHNKISKPQTSSNEDIFLDIEKKVKEHIQWGLSQKDMEIYALAKFAENYKVCFFPQEERAYVRGRSGNIQIVNKNTVTDSPDVYFISYDLFRERNMSSHFGFVAGAVVITHLDWPQNFERAAFFHEVYHAKLKSEGRALGDERISEEEGAAHYLEYRILDILSGGKYSNVVKQISDSLPQGTAQEQVEVLSFFQLRMLDEAISVQKTGQSQMNSIYTQHVLSVLMENSKEYGRGTVPQKYLEFLGVNQKLMAILIRKFNG